MLGIQYGSYVHIGWILCYSKIQILLLPTVFNIISINVDFDKHQFSLRYFSCIMSNINYLDYIIFKQAVIKTGIGKSLRFFFYASLVLRTGRQTNLNQRQHSWHFYAKWRSIILVNFTLWLTINSYFSIIWIFRPVFSSFI